MFGIDGDLVRQLGFLLVGGIVLFIVGMIMQKVPILGWFLTGITLIAINFWLGSMWIIVLPGAVARVESYAPAPLGWGVQIFITIFQLMLFSGALIEGAADTILEKVYLVLGVITTISDIVANSIPWAVGGNVQSSTLFADWGAWFARSMSSPLDFAAFVIIMTLSLIIAIGGEVSMARCLKLLNARVVDIE